MNFGGLSDLFDSAGSAIKDAGDWGGDLAKDIGNSAVDFYHGIERSGQNTLDNIDNVWKSGIDLTKMALTAPTTTAWNTASDVARDPTDINSWTDSSRRTARQFDDIGTDLFGSGGWVTGGVNYVSTGGNPFYGAGTTSAQLIEGDDYTPGSTTSAGNLMGLANTVSGLSSSNPTYTEAGPNGSTVSVTPNDYYNTNTAANVGNLNSNTSYIESPGAPYKSVDVNPFAYGQQAGNTVTSPQAPTTFWDDLHSAYNDVSGYVNSPGGKLGLSVAGKSNPDVANLTRLATSGSDSGGGYGQAIESLGSLYKGYQTRQQLNKTRDDLQGQLNQALGSYSPDSAYGQQLRKTLQRQDAAAGRTSQYGTREVELAARLADKQNAVRQAYMGQAPTLLAMNSKIAGAKNAGLADVFSAYGKNFDKVNNTVSSAGRSLYNYFNTPSQSSSFDAGTLPLYNQG